MAESKSVKKESTKNLVTTIREGAIAANVWRRQTPTGFEYLDFSLSRSWKMKTGEKEGYSHNFFSRNEEALVEIVRKACQFIREHEEQEADAAGREKIAAAA